VIILDATAIVVVIFSALFIIGGPIIGSLAVKASENAEKKETDDSNSK
jgi:hypothetical protein